jgi:hypothetical protein
VIRSEEGVEVQLLGMQRHPELIRVGGAKLWFGEDNQPHEIHLFMRRWPART